LKSKSNINKGAYTVTKVMQSKLASNQTRKIVSIDPYTRERTVYDGATAFAKASGIKSPQSINKACRLWEKERLHTKVFGYFWEYDLSGLELHEGESFCTLKLLGNGTKDVEVCENVEFCFDGGKYFSRYIMVTTEGRCFNSKSQKWEDGYLHPSGYYIIHRGGFFFKLHRLIALAFQVPGATATTLSDMADLEVDHVDGNKSNNMPANLKWLTTTEHRRKSLRDPGRKKVPHKGRSIDQFDLQTGKVVKTWDGLYAIAKHYDVYPQTFQIHNDKPRKAMGFGWIHTPDKEVSGETFVDLTLPDGLVIKVSNMGRVENASGKRWHGSLRPDGYRCVRYNNKGYKIHRLIAEAFHRKELEALLASSGLPQNKLEVDHKNEDRGNNHADNLEWITRKKHMQKTGKTRKTEEAHA
jgi:hypothetical protein